MADHDPLCPFVDWSEEECYQQDAGISMCALIARVREDEATRAHRISDAYRTALRDAVEAVVNCDDYHSAANMLLVDAYREGLQAAREAIEALGGER